jgi:hypothetical protein
MTPEGARPAGPEPTPARASTKRLKRYEVHLLAAYLVCAVAALIFLRASVDELDFLGVGWIVVLATLPLLPWLIPRLAQFVKTVSPYVQTLKVGAVQVDLRTAQRTPISIATAGMQPGLPNDVSALSAGTGISSLMNALRELERQGGSPVGVIDLQDGHKWRLPNVFFLARLLELEPVVRQLVFTEMKGGIDGYLVGSASPQGRSPADRTGRAPVRDRGGDAPAARRSHPGRPNDGATRRVRLSRLPRLPRPGFRPRRRPGVRVSLQRSTGHARRAAG